MKSQLKTVKKRKLRSQNKKRSTRKNVCLLMIMHYQNQHLYPKHIQLQLQVLHPQTLLIQLQKILIQPNILQLLQRLLNLRRNHFIRFTHLHIMPPKLKLTCTITISINRNNSKEHSYCNSPWLTHQLIQR